MELDGNKLHRAGIRAMSGNPAANRVGVNTRDTGDAVF
jgi:hypothetical protein